MAKELTYGEYINVPAIRGLLRLPERPDNVPAEAWPQTPEGWQPGDPWPNSPLWVHDESLFITTHQAFEVWFRQLLIELDDLLRTALARAELHGIQVPRIALAQRQPDRVRQLGTNEAFLRKFYPQVAELIQKLPAPWQDALRDTPAPGAYAEETARPQLAWFDDLWGTWTERLERARRILEVTTPFYSVLATMTPASFLEFRGRLIPASGFGSGQFREVELALGQRERHLHRFPWQNDPELEELLNQLVTPADLENIKRRAHPQDAFTRHTPLDADQVRKRLLGPSLRDLVYWLLGAAEYAGKEGENLRPLGDQIAAKSYAEMAKDVLLDPANPRLARPDEALIAEFARALAHPETLVATQMLRQGLSNPVNRFLDACLTLDEALLAWRDAHIRFVERMIGAKPGTGGGGIAYLRGTVNRDPDKEHLLRSFPALWAARSFL